MNKNSTEIDVKGISPAAAEILCQLAEVPDVESAVKVLERRHGRLGYVGRVVKEATRMCQAGMTHYYSREELASKIIPNLQKEDQEWEKKKAEEVREFLQAHPEGSMVRARIGGRGCKFHGEDSAEVKLVRVTRSSPTVFTATVEFSPKKGRVPTVRQIWYSWELFARMEDAKGVDAVR